MQAIEARLQHADESPPGFIQKVLDVISPDLDKKIVAFFE